MRKVLIAAVAAFAGMSTTAYAADIYEGSLKDEPVAYAPAPIWTGFYVGGHIGGVWNDSGKSKEYKGECDDQDCNTSFAAPVCETCADWRLVKAFDDDDDVSLLGGVHVGYNWQYGSRVYGIEGDVSFADGLDYLASLRARLGHLLSDDLMIYATAGIAFAGFDDKVIAPAVEVAGDSEVGFVIGGGIERKLTSNMSIGLEGLYYAFDDAKFSKEWVDDCIKYTHEDDNDLFVVRARLSYSLHRDEPSLESYK